MQIQTNISPKKFSQVIYLTAAIAIIGGFLSFVFLAHTESTTQALSIGYFYASSLILVLFFVQRIVISKLQVFNPFQQWIFRTFVYTISVSAVYLAGLVFQSLVLKPDISFSQILSERIWSSFVTFISSPLDLQFADEFLQEEFRTLLIPFFAIIILIGLGSILGSYVEIRWQHNRQQQAVNKAELTALKAQIEPHFIFNSLNTIASQIKSDPEKAEKLLIKLSDTLRYLFDSTDQEMVSLESEINFLKKYISLMKARFEDRLIVRWEISLQSSQSEIPVLLLQPAIENVMRHGWRHDGSPLTLLIAILENEKGICIKIVDDGRGISPQRLKMLPVNGHALANVVDRLKLTYKRNDLFQLKSILNEGTEIVIEIPKEL